MLALNHLVELLEDVLPFFGHCFSLGLVAHQEGLDGVDDGGLTHIGPPDEADVSEVDLLLGRVHGHEFELGFLNGCIQGL